VPGKLARILYTIPHSDLAEKRLPKVVGESVNLLLGGRLEFASEKMF